MSQSEWNDVLNDLSQWIHQEKEHSKFYAPCQRVHSKEIKPAIVEAKQEAHFSHELKQAKVVLLHSSAQPKEVALIEKMTAAIDARIAKAACLRIDQSQSEDYFAQLKKHLQAAQWILLPESDLLATPSLNSYYKSEMPRKLLGRSVFFLSDLSCYLKDQELKKQLWMTLLRTL